MPFQHLTLSEVKEAKIKIALVDDHSIVLDGLVSLLSHDERFEVTGAFQTAEQVFAFLKKEQPDILLTDYGLQGISGLELVRRVKDDFPLMKIVMLSMHDEAHIIKAALKAGVDGYLLKNIPQEELKGALKHVAKGLPYVSPEVTRLLMEEMNKPKEDAQLLTERERDVLRLITKEFSNKEIADQLFISERTVETHRKNIFKKTKTNTVVGLMKYAFEQKFE
jgi:two-component system, NarL family, nitrate/nitrite response regulator NarL